jgi:hypothetical protein
MFHLKGGFSRPTLARGEAGRSKKRIRAITTDHQRHSPIQSSKNNFRLLTEKKKTPSVRRTENRENL